MEYDYALLKHQISILEMLKDIKASKLMKTQVKIPDNITDCERQLFKAGAVLRKIFKDKEYYVKKESGRASWVIETKTRQKLIPFDEFCGYLNGHAKIRRFAIKNPEAIGYSSRGVFVSSKTVHLIKRRRLGRHATYNKKWLEQAFDIYKITQSALDLVDELAEEYKQKQEEKKPTISLRDSVRLQLINSIKKEN